MKCASKGNTKTNEADFKITKKFLNAIFVKTAESVKWVNLSNVPNVILTGTKAIKY